MKVFGHEGKCTCRYNTHGWIVYIMLFPVVCGTSRGSSWLRRNEFLKMIKSNFKGNKKKRRPDFKGG
jgi:hypothetical protein